MKVKMDDRMRKSLSNLLIGIVILVFALIFLYQLYPNKPFRLSAQGVVVEYEKGEITGCEMIDVRINATNSYVSPRGISVAGIHMLHGYVYVGEEQYQFIGSLEAVSEDHESNFFFYVTQDEEDVGMMYMSGDKKRLELHLHPKVWEDGTVGYQSRVVAPAQSLEDVEENALVEID